MVILRSLIQNGMVLTFDCAKCRITKGDTIQIEDRFYFEDEIQNAIKMKLVEVVGDPPAPPEGVTINVKTITLINALKTRLALDCIRTTVLPQDKVEVPETKLHHPEVVSALRQKLLVPPEGVEIPDLPVSTIRSRPKIPVNSESKGRQIRRAGQSGVEDGLEDDFKESKVIDASLAALGLDSPEVAVRKEEKPVQPAKQIEEKPGKAVSPRESLPEELASWMDIFSDADAQD